MNKIMKMQFASVKEILEFIKVNQIHSYEIDGGDNLLTLKHCEPGISYMNMDRVLSIVTEEIK